MLSVSHTEVCFDDDRPGPASEAGYGSAFATIGPDYPESRWTGRNLRDFARRLAALLVVLSVLVLVGVGVANVQVAHDRKIVEPDLAAARAAAERVSVDLTAGPITALPGDLDRLARSGTAARAGSASIAWTVATRADLGGGQLRALRRDTGRLAALAAAAGPLRDSLAPLTAAETAGASMTGPEGPNGLYALDDLARGFNRYATAAERTGDPSAAVAARAALAAGMLPTLAGGDEPRIWTVCRVATGPCQRIRVADARSGTPVPGPASGTASPPGRRWATGIDVLVIGVDPETLFRAGTFQTAAIFDLLYHLDQDRGAVRTDSAVSIRSALGPEQQAIDQLSRP